jgi:hypothetical protein
MMQETATDEHAAASTGGAIMKWIALLLAVTFFLSDGLAQTLLGGLSPTQVRQAQAQLKKSGFDPGPIDGVLGAHTTAAIRQYQARHGLSETGLLDEATRKVLGLSEEKPQRTLTPDFAQATSQSPPHSSSVPQPVPAKPVEPHVGEGSAQGQAATDGIDLLQPIPEKPTESPAGNGSVQGRTATDWVHFVVLVILGLIVGALLIWVIQARISKKHQEELSKSQAHLLNLSKMNQQLIDDKWKFSSELIMKYLAILHSIEENTELTEYEKRVMKQNFLNSIGSKQYVRSSSPSSSSSSSPLSSG